MQIKLFFTYLTVTILTFLWHQSAGLAFPFFTSTLCMSLAVLCLSVGPAALHRTI